MKELKVRNALLSLTNTIIPKPYRLVYLEGHTAFNNKPYKGYVLVKCSIIVDEPNSFATASHWMNDFLIWLKSNPRSYEN